MYFKYIEMYQNAHLDNVAYFHMVLRGNEADWY